MNSPNYTYLILLSIVILVLLFFSRKQNKTYTWYQCSDKDKGMNVMRQVLLKHKLRKTTDTKGWNIYLPCDNKYSNKYVRKVRPRIEQMVGFIENNGILGSKVGLWKTLKNYYGFDKAGVIMPRSYILPQDREQFDRDYDKNKLYVLKNEKQRQQGIKLEREYWDIVNYKDQGFKIIQEYEKHPLLFHGHKLNFRIYLLVVCDGDKKTGYLYNDGIVSYTENPNTNVIDYGNGIASFYTSKDLYSRRGFPILISQLQNLKKTVPWGLLFNRFSSLTRGVLNASGIDLCKISKNAGSKNFQLFGIDFFVNTNYEPKILEINIGPGMTPLLEDDKEMRIRMHEDILGKLNIIPRPINNFKKIWEN
ncbi:MAG: hypothetical protein CMF62_03815 [Magnetococcales bacterium]|nr:hypothetical protein [Magnetococcales bacterium]|tara:strand:+ start:36891 stop:37979 length:1089 start_codon:yes stop_codon:yes gene_type:complete